jgi:hypothetical protein
VSSARRLVLPLIAKNRMLSARLAWSRLSVHVVQLVNWAFQEVREDMLPLYVSMAWDLMPLLSSSCSSYTLQGERESRNRGRRQRDALVVFACCCSTAAMPVDWLTGFESCACHMLSIAVHVVVH